MSFGSGPAQVGGNQTAGKTVNLRTVIVKVVLARHVGTLRDEDAREAVAHGCPAGAAHVNRSGWVSRDELKVHGYALVERTGAEFLTRGHNDACELSGGGGIESDIDEARSRHVRTCHAEHPGQVLCHLSGENTRSQPDRFCDLESNTRRPISVVTVLGALNHNVGDRE
jgi:hypothetical protein